MKLYLSSKKIYCEIRVKKKKNSKTYPFVPPIASEETDARDSEEIPNLATTSAAMHRRVHCTHSATRWTSLSDMEEEEEVGEEEEVEGCRSFSREFLLFDRIFRCFQKKKKNQEKKKFLKKYLIFISQ